MRRVSTSRALAIAAWCIGTVVAACGAPPLPATDACLLERAAAGARVLVFTRTTGFRHESIPAGVAAVVTLGERYGFAVEHTEQASAFDDASLARFAAVVFLNTTGDVLDSAQQAALERFVRGGGGFVGVHSAADTEYDWEWYGQLVGARFRSHPPVQRATVRVVDGSHPSTRCLPATWVREDEWYDFRAPPVTGTTILATVDEATYSGGSTGAGHAVAWYHGVGGGRAWYTALGHTDESYAEPAFLAHLAGGILWAAAR